MRMEEKFSNLVQAQNRVIMVISHEIERIHGFANTTNIPWYTWNSISGLKHFNRHKESFETVDGYEDNPQIILDELLEQKSDFKNAIIIIENSHFYLNEHDIKNIQRIKNYCNSPFSATIVLQQPNISIPMELEKDIALLETDYPTIIDIEYIYSEVCEQLRISAQIESSRNLLNSLLGLTIMEARSALKQAYVEKKKLDDSCISVALRTKEQIIKKSGYLEYYHPNDTLTSIGGLENLKSWLKKRGNAYSKNAKKFGLSTPKGILLLGVPGSGKSLTAKAVSAEWNFPLLKLDMGKIFGSLLGQSEANIRNALQIAEALSPCILWVDEIEKGLSNPAGQQDGGSSTRVLGTFLTWMQEKSKPVFILATANDVSRLPAELLRKGRFDEIFFVDIPSEKEREEIFKIHIAKIPQDSRETSFNFSELVAVSVGFTGAEIEEAIKEALFTAFNENNKLSNNEIVHALNNTYPLSKTMAENIQNIRKWASKRAVLASKDDKEVIHSEDSIPVLKQERISPFLSKKKDI